MIQSPPTTWQDDALTSTDPYELKHKWLDVALRAAKIDRSRWRPGIGVEENRRTIGDVYDYYGRLFAHNPFLLWTGMASMIGPAFYAAFLDLGFLPDKARQFARTVLDWTTRRESREAAGELGFYETLFLTMQKKIFEDQATMHEAYLEGGVPEIERLYQASIIDLATLAAWQQIDQGRRDGTWEALESACRILLWREQRVIIAHLYDTMMHHHGLEGQLFTYALTCVATPSVPGARSESQVYPLVVTPPVLRRPSLTTPLAQGNLARFADRWRLIERDTLPAYLKLVREDAASASAIVQKPIFERAARYRLRARAGAILAAAVTRWRLGFGLDPDGEADEQATATGEPIRLDLGVRPAPDALGIRPPARTRVWISATPRPLDVQVQLPGRRVYDADAELVAATGLAVDGAPNHIMVRLGGADVEGAGDLLRKYAADWGIDGAELATWREHERRAGSSSHQSHATHVLGPVTVGFVTLEFEVAYHVREKECEIAALFSW
jgi:hypothetical protein